MPEQSSHLKRKESHARPEELGLCSLPGQWREASRAGMLGSRGEVGRGRGNRGREEGMGRSDQERKGEVGGGQEMEDSSGGGRGKWLGEKMRPEEGGGREEGRSGGQEERGQAEEEERRV